jgi:3-oxoadipate enol-lactonase
VKHTYNGSVRIAYEEVGDGPLLVFVHANPFDHRLWLYQVARYARTHRIVNVDLRGYGESDKPDGPFSLNDMADDVLAACDAEGGGRAVVVGASVGAAIALAIALDHPDRTAGLVLVGGAARSSPTFPERIRGYTSDDPVGYQRAHIARSVGPTFAESELGRWLLGIFTDDSFAFSGPAIAQNLRAYMDFDVVARLPTIAIPTLVINGALDTALPLSAEIAAGIPNARHELIPACGHACCLEDPTRFDAILEPFLAALTG